MRQSNENLKSLAERETVWSFRIQHSESLSSNWIMLYDNINVDSATRVSKKKTMLPSEALLSRPQAVVTKSMSIDTWYDYSIRY